MNISEEYCTLYGLCIAYIVFTLFPAWVDSVRYADQNFLVLKLYYVCEYYADIATALYFARQLFHCQSSAVSGHYVLLEGET